MTFATIDRQLELIEREISLVVSCACLTDESSYLSLDF